MEIINKKDGMDVWKCSCGTFIPVKEGSPKPSCEYCRRVEEAKIESIS